MAEGRVPAGRLAAVGFLSMAGQVCLLRELAVASFGVELVFLLGLGLWMAGGAAGALAARAPREGAPGTPGSAPAFLLLALLLPLALLFLRGSRVLFGGVPGAFLPLLQQAAVAFLAVVPPSAALGWLFARLAGPASGGPGDKGVLARAYAWESAGGAAGSVAAALALLAGVPNLAILLLSAAGSAALAAPSRPLRPFAFALAAALAGLAAAAGPLDLATTRWNHPGLVAVADTSHGRVAVAKAGEQTVTFQNDALVSDSEGTGAEEFAALAALQARPGARALVLGGGGAPQLVEELLRHSPSSVEVVEGDRRALAAVVPHLPERTSRALSAPPVRVIYADPRRHLAAAGSYDLILVAAGEPTSGESNRFYTAEFFALCAMHLAPGGVVGARLPSAENLWTPLLAERNASVFAALSRAFPSTLVVPGTTDTLLGSNRLLFPEPEALVRRQAERGVEGRLVTPRYLRYLFTNDRMARADSALRGASAPPDTDARPVCYRQAVLLWVERFLPPGALRGDPVRGWGAPLAAAAALALAALAWLSRSRPALGAGALAGLAGFAGMALESLVLLRFQAESGALYRDIGLLLTSFMAGLSGGAFLLGRLPGRGLLATVALLSGGLAWGAGSGWPFGLLPAAGTLLLAGALTGGVFAWAGRTGAAGPGPLYAADLLGGAGGAVVAGLFLLPLAGTAATAEAVASLSLLGAALVIPRKP